MWKDRCTSNDLPHILVNPYCLQPAMHFFCLRKSPSFTPTSYRWGHPNWNSGWINWSWNILICWVSLSFLHLGRWCCLKVFLSENMAILLFDEGEGFAAMFILILDIYIYIFQMEMSSRMLQHHFHKSLLWEEVQYVVRRYVNGGIIENHGNIPDISDWNKMHVCFLKSTLLRTNISFSQGIVCGGW